MSRATVSVRPIIRCCKVPGLLRLSASSYVDVPVDAGLHTRSRMVRARYMALGSRNGTLSHVPDFDLLYALSTRPPHFSHQGVTCILNQTGFHIDREELGADVCPSYGVRCFAMPSKVCRCHNLPALCGAREWWTRQNLHYCGRGTIVNHWPMFPQPRTLQRMFSASS